MTPRSQLRRALRAARLRGDSSIALCCEVALDGPHSARIEAVRVLVTFGLLACAYCDDCGSPRPEDTSACPRCAR